MTLKDIESKLNHYKDEFKSKVVYCNCDDYRNSNFIKYFLTNFKELGLKKFIATGIGAMYITFNGREKILRNLKGNGDFRSDECLELMKESDLIITRPPEALINTFISLVEKFKKKFLIVDNDSNWILNLKEINLSKNITDLSKKKPKRNSKRSQKDISQKDLT